MTLQPHAVHRLYQYRKSISTKPYASRGQHLVRCQWCLLAQQFCTCPLRQSVFSNVSFLLLMYDSEVLKPSNSGRLIADLIPDTHAFLWQRTQINTDLLAVINDDKYQPFVIFPANYAKSGQTVVADNESLAITTGRRPLFIMLDGNWRQAVKMFNKSDYLQGIPVLSFSPQTAATYGLRKGVRDFQLGTAEVAALALAIAGEAQNASALNAWFELFVQSSFYVRGSSRNENLKPLEQLKDNFSRALAAC